MRASLRPKALVALALAIAVLDACGTGHTPSPPAQLPTAPVDNLIAAQLAHIEQQLARIQASEHRLSGHRPAIRPCRSSPYARLLTMPAQCTAESAREDARAALGTLVRALVRDIRPLAARLRRLSERSPYGDGAWPLISGRLLGSTVNHLVWITDALHESCTLTEIARLGSRDWQWAAHHYEGALLGAQVLSVWVSWLDFARELYVRTTISPEWILVQLAAPWNGEIKIVLNQRNAIGEARRAGEPWRARLLERQARGRWMERRMSDKFKELRWRGKGVDAVDPVTGLQYEVLSGTRSNLDLHGHAWPGRCFA